MRLHKPKRAEAQAPRDWESCPPFPAEALRRSPDASGSPAPRPLSPLHLPTSSDDFQQKNRQPIFGDVETRLKMTFHSLTEKLRAARRKRKPLSKTPLLFFHYENAFPKKGKTISIQTHPSLIISQHEHPIRKTAKPQRPQ